MGNHIVDIPWLDPETRALMQDLAASLINHHPALLAIVLYGSIAARSHFSLFHEISQNGMRHS